MKNVLNTHLKNMYIVVDTETLGFKGGKQYNQKVFDIGYQIVDKNNNVYSEGSFLVAEFWERIPSLKGAIFYDKKAKLYEERVKSGYTKVLPWNSILQLLSHEMACYDVDYFAAYNLAFDWRVIRQTHEFLKGNEPFNLYDEVEPFDIYHVACQLLLNRPTYKALAKRNERMTKGGNYQSGAEATYAYIRGPWDYVEEHTALEDVKIEAEILAYCMRQKKPFDCSINGQSWRLLKDTAPKPSKQLALAI